MYALLPDTDVAIVAFLTNHASLSPLHTGRVGTSLGAGTASALRITSLGGPQPWPWEGTTEYQIEAWGGTQAQAMTLTNTVCTAIYDMRGAITGGHVINSVPTLRPLWSPDPDTGRARYICQVSITYCYVS